MSKCTKGEEEQRKDGLHPSTLELDSWLILFHRHQAVPQLTETKKKEEINLCYNSKKFKSELPGRLPLFIGG